MTVTYRLGIDIGGTFTDVMLTDNNGRVAATLKTPSVPSAPEQAILNAIEQLKAIPIDIEAVELFVHGTTLGVNTLIERSGATTGLLVTRGFRDVLEIRRLRLENTTNLYGDKPDPLVPRYLVKEIDERCLADGRIYRPLAADDLRQSVQELLAEGVTAIAVSFLHSYHNPEHERQAVELIRKEFPGVFVCSSSEVWPQQREYERTLVTVMNAYIGSRMNGYFRKLEVGVKERGLHAQVLSTMSNGGIMTAQRAADEPVKTLLSGPASGVIGATHVARLAAINKVVTFDMGGTSVDVAVIDGEPAYSSENQIGDFPVIIPAVDVTAIGAGGGSIAWVDGVGVLKVGPCSAGADPGPACYGRGGLNPTTTDAYVHLGIIRPDRFLGGRMPLNEELAAAALKRLGAGLGLDSQKTAQAILDVATANMYAQFTPLMARKGIDPRDFTLLAYGGAGPTHAFLLAREVGIRRVLVPPSPGTLCATGCVVADLRNDFVYTLYKTEQQLEEGELERIFKDLAEQGHHWLETESSRGIELESTYMLYSADMRYEGQAFDIEVSIPSENLEANPVAETADGTVCFVQEAVRRFHRQYEAIFGVSQPESSVSFVNLRATIVGVTHKADTMQIPDHDDLSHQPGHAPVPEARTIYFDGVEMKAHIVRRSDLPTTEAWSGPVIIEEYDTTVFVPPGYSVKIDNLGNIIGEVEG
ncbi:hydantoinase/oxoprolinase family protein [Paenibacillus kribbensis]|uniref:hydantoinase/oxoprolinase family protein n=2 Tax=Paenibacillus TaxID=44249 RepID=UPI002DB91A76|nr:hydantoinase/oxoprolinase family protein [Paenibacillus kribbensis]MEC0235985.1 hydantoinase/oxoprolinase family protein [Paenibacillus kribbensis]